MSKSQWISWPLARAAFLRQAVEHGGRSNYDMVRFQAALAWPQTVFSFMGRVTVFDLAAAYADGVVRMRPFGQGNGRMAWLLCALFMRINGVIIAAPVSEKAAMIVSLMRGLVDRSAFARWLHLCHISHLHGGNRTIVALRLRDKKVVGMSVLGSKQNMQGRAGDDLSVVPSGRTGGLTATQVFNLTPDEVASGSGF
ncbi:MAG: Fic family protein [Azonexus sp.]